MEHVKLLEVESQHLSFCSHMQQVQSEGAQTIERKSSEAFAETQDKRKPTI